MASTATHFDTDCGLMLHLDGADGSLVFTDSSFSNPKTVGSAGNVQIDTAQAKFDQSGLFDGTGDFLTINNSDDFKFGTGNFTIDFWIRHSAVDNSQTPFDDGNGASAGINFKIFPTTSDLQISINGTDVNYGSVTTVADTWYHYAIVRTGTDLLLFRNGAQVGTTQSNALDISPTTAFKIGQSSNNDRDVSGWIDEFRVVKGTAVWIASFTAPTAAYISAETSASVTGQTYNSFVF